MSTPFKNRLVGTIIVAAVVVIFLPDVLDGEKKSYQDDFEAIPSAPAFTGELSSKEFPVDKVVIKKQPQESTELALDGDKVIDDSDISSASNEQVNDKVAKITVASQNANNINNTSIVSPVTREDTKPLINREPEKAVVKEAWVIHLGSFKHKKNVEQLLSKLKANGYVTFTQPIETSHGTLTKVFIGPELIKSSLDKKIPKLKALTEIQGKVARFHPTK